MGRTASAQVTVTITGPTPSSTAGCTYDVSASDTSALIEAIEFTNTTAEAETLCLGGGTYALTAVYASGSVGNNGLPAIVSSLTINGNGAAITRSSAAAFRFFQVQQNVNLTLRDLALTNGSAIRGGALLTNYSGLLTLERVTLSGKTASDNGGGLFLRESVLSMTDSTVTGNTADDGGGMFLQGAAEIEGSTFSLNLATQRSGGAISTQLHTLRISNSTFSANQVDGYTSARGGAIHGNVSDITIILSTFYGNSANIGATFSTDAVATVAIYKSIIVDDSGDSCVIYSSSELYGGNNIGDDTSCEATVADPLL